MKLSKTLPLFFLLYLSMGAKSFAEPLFINFNEMIQQSKYIVIGTYLGGIQNGQITSSKFNFEVEEVLKGDIAMGKTHFNPSSGHISLPFGERCIAFVKEDNGFEWVGHNQSGKSITDNSLLFLEGFYDFNAYLVSPATLSVAQLKEYIKNGSFSGSMYGDLHFFSNTTKKMEPSPIQLEVKYTYTKENILTSDVKLNGISLNDFKKKAIFNLPCWSWDNNTVTIQYEYNLVRPLEIIGKILDIHPSANRFRILFWLDRPEELIYEEFLTFIKDPSLGHAYYELEVSTSAKKTYTIILNEELGRTGRLLDYNERDLEILSLSTGQEREIVFRLGDDESLILSMDSCLISKDELEFAGDELIRELKLGPIQATIYHQAKNADLYVGHCTLSYKSTKFARNPNYK